MGDIVEPVGKAVVRWLTAEEDGRRSGPPTANVYAATSVFFMGGDRELNPDWPRNADPTLSIWVQRVAVREDGSWLCRIDFPFRDLAIPYIAPGREFLIMEGPRVAAHAEFTDTYL